MEEITIKDMKAQAQSIVSKRDDVVGKIESALALLHEASKIMREMGVDASYSVKARQNEYGMKLGDRVDAADYLHVDKDLWHHFNKQFLGGVMNAAQRDSSWSEIERGDWGEFSADSLTQRLSTLNRDVEQTFVQSIYDIWTALDGDYKSNDKPMFGKKIIMTHAVESSAWGSCLTWRRKEQLRDMFKCINLYDGVSVDVSEFEEWSKDVLTGAWERFGPVQLKPFKNGNLHIKIADNMREQLNKTLAVAAGNKLHGERR